MVKPKLVKTDLDNQVAALAGSADHRTLAVWACDCAERVLPYFKEKHLDNDRPRKAIEAGRIWVRMGIFKMVNIRKASLASHAVAHEAEGTSAARSAARAAGQAVAVAHVSGHAIAAAVYAATAVRDGVEVAEADAAVTTERE